MCSERMTPVERYRHDAEFRALVDSLYVAIAAATFTPTEIREAAMLAQIKYEELHLRSIILETGWPTR